MTLRVDQGVFDALCSAYGAPLFLATSGPSGEVVVHSTVGGDDGRLREKAHDLGIARLKVRRCRPALIDTPRELETLAEHLSGSQTVLFDPLGVVTQAQGLVTFARRVRTAFGRQVRGVYFDSKRRLAIVCLKLAARDSRPQSDTRAILEDAAHGATAFPVLVSYRFPIRSAVAVDRQTWSAARRASRLVAVKRAGGALTALLGLGAGSAALAQNHMEHSITGGIVSGDHDDGAAVIGQSGFVNPRGFIQGELGLFSGDNEDSGMVGVQGGFVRDYGRTGIYAYAAESGGQDSSLTGVFGEYYFDSWTLRVEGGELVDDFIGSEEYIAAKIAVYFDEDLKGFISHSTLDTDYTEVGFEYAFSSLPGLIAGASLRNGDDFDSGNIFVKWYFRGAGGATTLKQQDRTGLASSAFEHSLLARAAASAAAAAAYGGLPPAP